jgi:aminoglycoside phosphotransferase (APT) family kinase protein
MIEDASVEAAARRAGLDPGSVELIRRGSNAMYRLPGKVVARLGPPGSHAVAAKEVAVASWLASAGIDTVRPLPGVPQPTMTEDGRPITWWQELASHRPATTAELGRALAAVHKLDVPTDPVLGDLDPFARCKDRILDAGSVGQADREWLLAHLERLQGRWRQLVADRSGRWGVVHGDAWQSNVVATSDGRLVLLDLEHVAVGPPEWDLAVLAVDHTDFDRVSTADYQGFVEAYGGYDVTTWPRFRTLGETWELRWTCFALAHASRGGPAAAKADHRIRCLQGRLPRPWTWNPI